MAFFTARVEYALHTILNLHRAEPGGTPSSRELAEFQRLPLAFTRRLLTQMEKAGLICGGEGLHGGWRLARPAGEITVLDVADAAQGGDELFECRNIRRLCALWPDDAPPASATAGVCSIHAVMLRAEAAMRHELASTTIAQLAGEVRAKGARGSQAAVPVWFAEQYRNRGTRRDRDRGAPPRHTTRRTGDG